jgi:hypothetical protein
VGKNAKKSRKRKKRKTRGFDRYLREQMNPRKRSERSMRVLLFEDDDLSTKRFRVIVNAYASNERGIKGYEMMKKAAGVMSELEKVMKTPLSEMTTNAMPELVPGKVVLEEAPYALLLDWVKEKTTPWYTGASIDIIECTEWLEGLTQVSPEELAPPAPEAPAPEVEAAVEAEAEVPDSE